MSDEQLWKVENCTFINAPEAMTDDQRLAIALRHADIEGPIPIWYADTVLAAMRKAEAVAKEEWLKHSLACQAEAVQMAVEKARREEREAFTKVLRGIFAEHPEIAIADAGVYDYVTGNIIEEGKWKP